VQKPRTCRIEIFSEMGFIASLENRISVWSGQGACRPKGFVFEALPERVPAPCILGLNTGCEEPLDRRHTAAWQKILLRQEVPVDRLASILHPITEQSNAAR
jgi:hypothetical protein